MWTYAGTVCSAPDPSGYYFPNDGIVGRSSAFGVSANLGSTARYQGNTFHQQTLETVLKLICSPFSGTGTELNDPAVISDVVHAAACSGAELRRRRGRRRMPARRSTSAQAPKPRFTSGSSSSCCPPTPRRRPPARRSPYPGRPA